MKWLKPDRWLSQYLDKPAYHLQADAPADGWQDELSTSEALFIATKLPVGAVDKVNALMVRGFSFADTMVDFAQVPEVAVADCAGSEITCRTAQPGDSDAVGHIAYTSPWSSRFHQDPMIQPSIANAIKRDWTQNFFKGQRGDACVIAEQDGQILGYCLLLAEVPYWRIDLIAVHPQYLGRGVARTLCQYVNKHYGAMKAGTQLLNKASIALYQSMGFKLVDAQYVLHCHALVYGEVECAE